MFCWIVWALTILSYHYMVDTKCLVFVVLLLTPLSKPYFLLVLGVIDPSELGLTMAHEHLNIDYKAYHYTVTTQYLVFVFLLLTPLSKPYFIVSSGCHWSIRAGVDHDSWTSQHWLQILFQTTTRKVQGLRQSPTHYRASVVDTSLSVCIKNSTRTEHQQVIIYECWHLSHRS